MADFNLAIPVIKRSEGGLSKHPSDTASKWPVPDGSGYHTNKGITWLVFSTNAKKLGYTATPELFYAMPDHIWNKITKQLYWDEISGDQLRSQAVATILVDWYFGSRAWAVKNLQTILNKHFNYKLAVDGVMGIMTTKAANAVDQKRLANLLQQARVAFIETISKRGDQGKFRNGWLEDAAYTFSIAQRYMPAISIGTLLVGASALFF